MFLFTTLKGNYMYHTLLIYDYRIEFIIFKDLSSIRYLIQGRYAFKVTFNKLFYIHVFIFELN